MSIALSLHLLSAVIWVGGMFFAYFALRPAAVETLEPPARLTLWVAVFNRFFKWVWLAVALLILTGHGMIALYGGFGHVGTHVHIMLGTGYLMMAIFAHLFFAPFKRLKLAVSESRWPDAGAQLNLIRKIVAINLTLGIITVLIASGGRYLL
ncbi:CopD family protein [Neptuniibacter sp. CAU 1671]|uniref:CopD family protein n=1 Tax=Neptuniibacter sp. CAU 1671 TaxID=3032593 RepID=UPI0023DCA414|nr:CopD family protein [Neptuniibacter sp. CAU 1671]MDF2181866.1 CopD family protein [Neptuniibacter sp. CAU 1671]